MTQKVLQPLATPVPWEMCGISRSHWYNLYKSGRTPRPVPLGTRRPVWLVSELKEWLEAGAPDQETWLKRL
jgi:predicted DNA-binding transcriptional regulator AlpA